MRFSVSVPVLSEQMTVTEPSAAVVPLIHRVTLREVHHPCCAKARNLAEDDPPLKGLGANNYGERLVF